MKAELIPEFIKLRARGLPYREIRQTVNVSRPIMCKWARLYAKKIERERQRVFREYERNGRKADAKRIKALSEQIGRDIEAYRNQVKSLQK